MAEKKDRMMEAVKKYLVEMDRICPIEKAILFGSCARRRTHKSSDIDLAIFSRKVSEKNRLFFTSLFLKETSKFKMDIQPLVFPYKEYIASENDFVVQEIRKKGIEVFG